MAILETLVAFALVVMFGGLIGMAFVSVAGFSHPALRLQLRMHLLVTIHLGLLIIAHWTTDALPTESILFSRTLFLPGGGVAAAIVSIPAQAAFAFELSVGVLGAFAVTRNTGSRRLRRWLRLLTGTLLGLVLIERIANMFALVHPGIAALIDLRVTLYAVTYIVNLSAGAFAVVRFVARIERPAIPVSRRVLVIVALACGWYVGTVIVLAVVTFATGTSSPVAVIAEYLALIVYLAGLGLVGLGVGFDVIARALRARASDPSVPSHSAEGAAGVPEGTLSDREREVIRLVVGGHLNKEIAAMLGVSEHTVRNHLARIFRKLGISRRAELVEWTLHSDPRTVGPRAPAPPPRAGDRPPGAR